MENYICVCLFSSNLFILSQDLPEFFEDNMETWMSNFHNLLTLDNKLLQTDVGLMFLFHTSTQPRISVK